MSSLGISGGVYIRCRLMNTLTTRIFGFMCTQVGKRFYLSFKDLFGLLIQTQFVIVLKKHVRKNIH